MNREEIQNLISQEIRRELEIFSDRIVFAKNLQLQNGRNIQVGRGTGTKIGTATDQKLSVYGETPVVQASAISAPSGGGSGSTDAVDISARAKINEIRTALTNFGITA